jgi:hypothetical protein
MVVCINVCPSCCRKSGPLGCRIKPVPQRGLPLSLSAIKSEHTDGVIRRQLVLGESARQPEQPEVPAHPARPDADGSPQSTAAPGSWPAARDLALELGEREQHVERQTPHGGRGVELLRHRDERGVIGIQHINDLREILAGCGPAPEGTQCPLWLEFLRVIFQADPELISYIQRVCGYCLTGSIREHALFFLFGTGGNGKSVFVQTLAGILGTYHKTAPIETFTANRFNSHQQTLRGYVERGW